MTGSRSRPKPLAAIDIGSNSVLMAVAEFLPPGDFRILYESFRTTRLGGGMDRTGRLTEEGIRRTVGALEECRRKAEIFGVGNLRAVATAAAREAENPSDFLGPAKKALGAEIEVVSGRREAELTFLGTVGEAAGPTVVVDVGGRSTELIFARDGSVERVESLPIGAVRLRDSLPAEGILPQFVAALPLLPESLDRGEALDRRAVAVGGTATTLAAMHMGLRRYDGERVEGLSLGRNRLLELLEQVERTPAEERENIPGLPASRVDIIGSGGRILIRILADLGIEEVTFSSRGLRHGLLWEMSRKEA